MLSVLAFVPPLQQPSGIPTPFAQHLPLAISSVSGAGACSKFDVEEVDIDASGTYQNPFDPKDARVDAEVTCPDQTSYNLPGFFFQPYTRSLTDGKEVLSAVGKPTWKLRVCPTQSGTYKLRIKFEEKDGFAEKQFSFTAADTRAKGFVRVSPRDPHYFEFQSGAGYFPIGCNLLWSSQRGTFDYDDWLTSLSTNRANFQRVLTNSSLATFAMEVPGSARDGLGPYQFNLANSWKLDYVLDEARREGVQTTLCLDWSNELRIRNDHADWDHNILNQDNRGPLRVWTQFWSSAEAEKLYEDRLRYLVARYSAYTGVLAWELWRNVDEVQEYDSAVVRAWHTKIADRLSKLDPYHHMITTSFAAYSGDRDTYLLKKIDFAQIHLFSPRSVGVIADQLERRAEWGKPSLIAEVAADRENSHEHDDLSGVQVHDPLWISLVSGGAGAAAPWWWESLAKNGLFSLMAPIASFTSGIDFPSEAFRSSAAALSFPSRPSAEPTEIANVWSLVGNDACLVWIQQKGRNWHTVVEEKRRFDPVPASQVSLSDLASGTWNVEIWDTWTGKVSARFSTKVDLDGKATFSLPSFSSDIALRLLRSQP